MLVFHLDHDSNNPTLLHIYNDVTKLQSGISTKKLEDFKLFFEFQKKKFLQIYYACNKQKDMWVEQKTKKFLLTQFKTTYILTGQMSGFLSLFPCKRYSSISLLWSLYQGVVPNENTSHNNTPKDHLNKMGNILLNVLI